MKVLVIGATGRLGRDVCSALGARGIEHRGIGSSQLDITNRDAVCDYLTNAYPADVVILTAALVGLEKLDADPDRAYLVNSTGPKWVAEACRQTGATLLFISTDYVFSGEAGRPYTEEDTPDAVNVYGKTKILAENYITSTLEKYFILRIAWIFSDKGNDYVGSVVNAVEKGEAFPAIMVRNANPTYTRDIADRICEFIQTDAYGLYHVVSKGDCTQESLCEEVMRLMQKKIELLPQILPPGSVDRPKDTRLSTQKMCDAGFTPMPTWQDAVKRCLTNRGII